MWDSVTSGDGLRGRGWVAVLDGGVRGEEMGEGGREGAGGGSGRDRRKGEEGRREGEMAEEVRGGHVLV